MPKSNGFRKCTLLDESGTTPLHSSFCFIWILSLLDFAAHTQSDSPPQYADPHVFLLWKDLIDQAGVFIINLLGISWYSQVDSKD